MSPRKKIKVYPTRGGDREDAPDRSPRRPGRPKGKSGVTPAPPIYILLGETEYGKKVFAKASLRYRNGSAELHWRDGDRTRDFYIGRAARKSPTRGAAPRPGAGDAGGRLLLLKRGVKK